MRTIFVCENTSETGCKAKVGCAFAGLRESLRSALALDCRTVRQRRLTSAFRLARPVKNVNGAEKLGHWGGGIVYHLPDDRGP